jgi:hypothetical protein
MEQYPALYNIAHNKSDIIAKVLNASPPNVAFRRDLIGEFRWNLTENGKFSVDSMYKALVHSEVPVNKYKHIWKMKIPLKIKNFAWYLHRGVILTKDNLVKRNWQGSNVVSATMIKLSDIFYLSVSLHVLYGQPSK